MFMYLCVFCHFSIFIMHPQAEEYRADVLLFFGIFYRP
uniref:Uncharacterized protein n=1 Tax=Arundo donax TaxID=35708 RepID=A0A0A9DU89_ARUDO